MDFFFCFFFFGFINLQHEYFHTPKASLDLYFEIVMNMKSHERRVERNLSLLSWQEFKR